MTKVRLLFGTTIPGYPLLSTDLLWRTQFKAPEPFFLCEFSDGRSILLVDSLEYERAKKEAKNCTVELINPYIDRAKSLSLTETEGLIEFLKEQAPNQIVVPNEIPYIIVKKLLDFGFNILPQDQGVWYPERAVKRPEEIQYISEVQRKTEKVFSKVLNILQKSKIAADGVLLNRNGKVLTAEHLRRFMDIEFLREGCMAATTIIACGDQAVDVHCEGSGPLWANLPIVIDVFPRSKENWYWADMTRTVFKGRPTKAAREMYQTVLDAQCLAIDMIRPGVDGSTIYKAVTQFFDRKGYTTGIKDGVLQGFVHSVGHSLGLDLHEPPRICKISWTLQEGNIVTVEPGLYYLGIGGVRIEDLVVVEKERVRNLTSSPKELEDMIIP